MGEAERISEEETGARSDNEDADARCGDHIVELRHQGEVIARFSQLGVTEQRLQGECARHLVMKHGWDGCLWSRKEINGESN